MMWLLLAVSMTFSEGSQPSRIGLLTGSKDQCESLAAIGNRGAFDSIPGSPLAFFCYQVRE